MTTWGAVVEEGLGLEVPHKPPNILLIIGAFVTSDVGLADSEGFSKNSVNLFPELAAQVAAPHHLLGCVIAPGSLQHFYLHIGSIQITQLNIT